MALDKEIAQGIIDDFVISNDTELQKISTENKALFNASINALEFLSKKFGTGEKLVIPEKPKEALQFKEGDKFYIGVRSKDNIYTIIRIVLNDINEATIKDSDNNSFQYPIEEVKKAFSEGVWIKIEELPFKVGDKFKRVSTGKVYVISKIDKVAKLNEDNAVDVADSKTGFPENSYSKDDVIAYIMEGLWEKVEETSTPVEAKSLGFSVGDRFNVSQTNLNFTIDNISNTDIGLVYDDGLTAFVPITGFSDGLKSGYYKPISKASPKQNKVDLKVGDLIYDVRMGEFREVDQIDDAQKMIRFKPRIPNGMIKYTPFSDFNSMVKDGLFVKLSFKIGDTFETSTGETKQIISINGTVFDIMSNNDPAQRGAASYDSIQQMIDSGIWKKLSFSQPKAAAPQVITGSGTAFISAKLPKKTLSKDEKLIKSLQKEIDGLELIADFDEEAKAELEKKQAEIKALKSKIS